MLGMLGTKGIKGVKVTLLNTSPKLGEVPKGREEVEANTQQNSSPVLGEVAESRRGLSVLLAISH